MIFLGIILGFLLCLVLVSTGVVTVTLREKKKNECCKEEYDTVKEENPTLTKIKHHGILKFNKETGKVNYKDFTVYDTTRPCLGKPRINGKPQTEKYIRTYQDDLKVFNTLVDLWHAVNTGE